MNKQFLRRNYKVLICDACDFVFEWLSESEKNRLPNFCPECATLFNFTVDKDQFIQFTIETRLGRLSSSTNVRWKT